MYLSAFNVQCQPAPLTGWVYCAPYCDPNDPRPRGQSCSVRVYAEGSSMWPREEIEGWWMIWSESDKQMYYIYDGRLDVDGYGVRRRFTLCDRRCGYYLQGYAWVWLLPDFPEVSHPGAIVETSNCEDCLQPTPVIGQGAPPTRCRGRLFFPAVQQP